MTEQTRNDSEIIAWKNICNFIHTQEKK
jgi:hypothetical protein